MRISWKDIEGYEGLYKVSNHGEVWSVRKQGLLKKNDGEKNYYRVTLSKNKKKKQFNIHRLVATHFIDNPFKKPCVNHLDENKTNNHYSNLEWVTHKENSNWGTRNNRIKESLKHSPKWESYTKRRINKGNSKPIVGVNIDNGEIVEFPSIREASRNGYHESNVWMCINGRRSTHKRCKWFYKHDFMQGVR